MVIATSQKKCLSLLLILISSLAAPVYAGSIRYDFDTLTGWLIHRDCIPGAGLNPAGPWSVIIEDGILKIMDGGCNQGSYTGIYQLESWTDYEVKARIQLKSTKGGVELSVRTQRCAADEGCWAGPLRDGFQGPHYRIWRDSPVKTFQWYDVKIVAEGQKVTYFFDGQKVSEETTNIMSGGLAFITSNCEFWLDYVEIKGVDVFAVQPQDRLATCWATLKSKVES